MILISKIPKQKTATDLFVANIEQEPWDEGSALAQSSIQGQPACPSPRSSSHPAPAKPKCDRTAAMTTEVKHAGNHKSE